MTASMMFAKSLVITNLVPLVTLGGSKDHKMIIGTAVFNESKCDRSPEIFKEFKNSVGKCIASDSLSTESSDLYSTGSPGNCSTKAVLIVRVVLLSGAKMRHSESQAMFLKFDNKSGYTGNQFIYAANKGSYIFRQLNYIRANIQGRM